MYYEFYSINEYIEYLLHAKKNPIFTGNASETGDFAFTDTGSFEEAINLAKYGYHEDFDKMNKNEFFDSFFHRNHHIHEQIQCIN